VGVVVSVVFIGGEEGGNDFQIQEVKGRSSEWVPEIVRFVWSVSQFTRSFCPSTSTHVLNSSITTRLSSASRPKC
jgi:hypothetical protein